MQKFLSVKQSCWVRPCDACEIPIKLFGAEDTKAAKPTATEDESPSATRACSAQCVECGSIDLRTESAMAAPPHNEPIDLMSPWY